MKSPPASADVARSNLVDNITLQSTFIEFENPSSLLNKLWLVTH